MILRIKEKRTEAGLSQAQVARAMEVNQSVVYRWETGEGNPSIDKLPRLAALFKCTIDDLYAADAAS